MRGSLYPMCLMPVPAEMSGPQKDNDTTTSTYLTETRDQMMEAAMSEFRVFNMVIVGLALCILTATGLYCLSVCYSRTRQSKRAALYESVVAREQRENSVAVRAVKRSTSFITFALFNKPEKAKEKEISYIYSNPLPIGVEEEEVVQAACRLEKGTALSIQDYAKDPNSGVILAPPVFYMQL